MAPLRSPSSSWLDDPLSVDSSVDPAPDPFGEVRARPVGRWSALDRLAERYPWVPTSPARVAAGVGAVAVVVLAGWWFLRPSPPAVETSLPQAGATQDGATGSTVASSATAAAVTSTTSAEVVVQAAGSVARPGVYRLPPTARVDDLVRAAGGLGPHADADRVNLAAPLADGSRIWVPAQGEDQPPEVVAGAGGGAASAGPGAGGAAASAAAPEVVDLNTATAEQLDVLPGVGPSTASAILAYRNEHGPFASVDDLLEVRGIGDAKLEQIRPQARV